MSEHFLTLRNGRKIRLNTPEEDAAITKAALSDPDALPLTDEDFKRMRVVGRPKAAVTKQPVTLRLDPEVLARWRATGKGWQTRMAERLAL
ncbi:MAG: BrnA antitoxin family protein [Azoarcus sp.]|jgi:uncharacterized protein (DUF4415 family)|nr:BrnA antitoxin family protein [Azoarcus sp.]